MQREHFETIDENQPLSRRALYNCLRLQAQNGDHDFEAWQVEDYRKWPIDKLFAHLHFLGWEIDKASFLAYAESVEGPDELLELWLGEQELTPQKEDRLYLIIFEVWRRLAGTSGNIELLCDELDYQMAAYDDGEQVDSNVESALSQLEKLIREQSDEEEDAKETFAWISTRLAHDLELFLYDFILDQIEAGASDFAEELYTRFFDLVESSLWLDLLKVRWCDDEEAALLLEKIYEQMEQDPNQELLFETVTYLSENEIGSYFERFFELTSRLKLDATEKSELGELADLYLQQHANKAHLRKQLLALLQQKK